MPATNVTLTAKFIAEEQTVEVITKPVNKAVKESGESKNELPQTGETINHSTSLLGLAMIAGIVGYTANKKRKKS